MIGRRRRAGFAHETLQPVCVLGELRRQQFNRDLPFQFRVTRQPDFAHPTRAEQRKNLIVTDLLARRGMILRQYFGGNCACRRSDEVMRLGLCIRRNQLLDGLPQRFVFATGAEQEGAALPGFQAQRRLIEATDLLIAFRGHDGESCR